jgi:hypothetical protein
VFAYPVPNRGKIRHFLDILFYLPIFEKPDMENQSTGSESVDMGEDVFRCSEESVLRASRLLDAFQVIQDETVAQAGFVLDLFATQNLAVQFAREKETENLDRADRLIHLFEESKLAHYDVFRKAGFMPVEKKPFRLLDKSVSQNLVANRFQLFQ